MPQWPSSRGFTCSARERLAQERVVEQVDLADREVVRGAPVRVDQRSSSAHERGALFLGHFHESSPLTKVDDGSAHHEHGAARVVNDLLADRAQQQACEASAAPIADDDQRSILRLSQQHVRRLAVDRLTFGLQSRR